MTEDADDDPEVKIAILIEKKYPEFRELSDEIASVIFWRRQFGRAAYDYLEPKTPAKLVDKLASVVAYAEQLASLDRDEFAKKYPEVSGVGRPLPDLSLTDPPSPQELQQLCSLEYWTKHEALCLMLNVQRKPDVLSHIKKLPHDNPLRTLYQRANEQLARAESTGSITVAATSQNWDDSSSFIDPRLFVSWAVQKKIPLPDKIIKTFAPAEKANEPELPPKEQTDGAYPDSGTLAVLQAKIAVLLQENAVLKKTAKAAQKNKENSTSALLTALSYGNFRGTPSKRTSQKALIDFIEKVNALPRPGESKAPTSRTTISRHLVDDSKLRLLLAELLPEVKSDSE